MKALRIVIDCALLFAFSGAVGYVAWAALL